MRIASEFDGTEGTILMSDSVEVPHTLMCSEVWGGNRKIFRSVQLASVTAWVASVPLDEGEGGGDLHYMSVCDHDLISRVALADVSGHGSVVSAMTETLKRLMRENIDAWDQSDFMRGLNDEFAINGQNKYATAVVLSFHRLTGRLSFSSAGHLPPLWYHAGEKVWGWLKEDDDQLSKRSSGLPIGLIPGTDYRQTIVNLEPSDLIVLYTDGVTEAENEAGESLDREQLLEWAQRAPTDSPQALGRALLERLTSFQGRCRNDDETLVVLQREKASWISLLLNVARSNITRMLHKEGSRAEQPAAIASAVSPMTTSVGRGCV
jgi:phosphoserine phosphatase RsbU/P